MKLLAVFFSVIALAGCGSTPAPEPRPQAAVTATVRPPKAPDEDAAIAAIAAINAGQKDYLGRNRRYALSYEELMQGFFLKEEPTAEKTGYDIKLRPSADAVRYTVVAAPATPSPTARHFFSDQTGDIHAEQGKDASADSPKITPQH